MPEEALADAPMGFLPTHLLPLCGGLAVLSHPGRFDQLVVGARPWAQVRPRGPKRPSSWDALARSHGSGLTPRTARFRGCSYGAVTVNFPMRFALTTVAPNLQVHLMPTESE
jgi:hypothetical protein